MLATEINRICFGTDRSPAGSPNRGDSASSQQPQLRRAATMSASEAKAALRSASGKLQRTSSTMMESAEKAVEKASLKAERVADRTASSIERAMVEMKSLVI